MLKKPISFIAILLLLTISNGSVLGEVALGVKAGDWIEYSVSTTGAPTEGHDVVWARMEILSIQDNQVTLNTTTTAVNGSYSSMIMTLNPSIGAVDVWAIIPANLTKGESFYDRNMGNIPIQGEEQKTFGGISRDTTFYNSSERFKRWDRATGVFLEGVDYQPSYSLSAVFLETNMWSDQLFGLEPTVFYIIVLALVASITAITLFLLIWRRSSKKL